MKLISRLIRGDYCGMPPTRGHDLKREGIREISERNKMPPTRGHDLKHFA